VLALVLRDLALQIPSASLAPGKALAGPWCLLARLPLPMPFLVRQRLMLAPRPRRKPNKT